MQLGINAELLRETTERNSKLDKKNRSKVVILVKNLPFQTEEMNLRNMFTYYGTLGKFILLPSRAIAVVEYLEPSEARKAFRALAFRPFMHQPLFLEWAPLGLLKRPDQIRRPGNPTGGSSSHSTSTSEEAEELDGVESSTLFIKNLNFNTTEDQLRALFSQFGPYLAFLLQVCSQEGSFFFLSCLLTPALHFFVQARCVVSHSRFERVGSDRDLDSWNSPPRKML